VKQGDEEKSNPFIEMTRESGTLKHPMLIRLDMELVKSAVPHLEVCIRKASLAAQGPARVITNLEETYSFPLAHSHRA
jgi:hypothetical protein